MSDIKVKMGSHSPKIKAEDKFEPFNIGEFRLKAPLTTKNSGFSKWGFCWKDGKEYFIKEFLTPVYPDDNVDIAPEIKNRRCKECNDWYEKKKIIYNKICEAANGNIIAPFRFFKDKSHFYIVTDKVPPCTMKFESLRFLPPPQKHLLMKVISASFSMLASKGIVHSDMKPQNILFKTTMPYQYTAKIIDFDASYLASDPPFGDDVQGTPEYFAPESFLALAEQRVELTPKVDVFSLGIIFHELLTGEKPAISSDFAYIYEAVLNDSEVRISTEIPKKYQEIISKMLCKEASERWSAAKVFNHLSAMTDRDLLS